MLPFGALSIDQLSADAVDARLRAVASRFSPALQPRVERILMAAAQAIPQLADLDLVRHESGAASHSSHSLAVWEELAPVMATTVQSTHEMIAIAEEAFPPPPEVDPLDNLDAAFGPPSTTPSRGHLDGTIPEPVSDEQEMSSLVSAIAGGLRSDVARLGERLRSPAVMMDPWHLIGDLLEFRGRLRAGIGELIFEIACRVEEVDRAQVVPGYQSDLDAAVLLRAAATNLWVLFAALHERALEASADELGRIHAEALAQLSAFARTRAITSMRTADKRIFLETRAQLHQLKEDAASPLEVRQSLDNMSTFLESLAVISRRENLRQHDRAALAGAGRLLEGAQNALEAGELLRARQQLSGAARAAWSLYGREGQLDGWLRGQRHFPVEWLADGELAREVEELGSLLGGIAVG